MFFLLLSLAFGYSSQSYDLHILELFSMLPGAETLKMNTYRHACNFCGKRFITPSKLDRHTLIHTGESPYICKYEIAYSENILGRSWLSFQSSKISAQSTDHLGLSSVMNHVILKASHTESTWIHIKNIHILCKLKWKTSKQMQIDGNQVRNPGEPGESEEH